MNDDLLLKATPELLTGWCGPISLGGVPAAWDPWSQCIIADVFGSHDMPIRFDMTRAECRDRVARVLAGVLYPDETDIERMTGGSSPWWLDWAGHIPTLLTTLDPNDDTRLADGSRRVDAMALLLVAREVLGE